MTISADPLAKRLAHSVRSRLASCGPDAQQTGRIRQVLGEMDAAAFEAPVGVGGYDLGLTSGVVVAAELGRRAVPDVYSGVAMTVDALAATGDPAGRASALSAGDLPVRVAGMDSGRAGAPTLTGHREDQTWVLTGRMTRDIDVDDSCWLVPFLAESRVWLALVKDESCRPVPRPGREHLAVDAVTLERFVVDPADVVGCLGSGFPISDEDGVLAKARIRHAAFLWGLGQYAWELAVDHANRRVQFGQPLMEFQGTSFSIAQAQVALAAVRQLVLAAVRSTEVGESLALSAMEALAQAAETSLQVVRTAMQVHGALGLTLRSQVHRYHLRVRSEATRFGSPEALWREAGMRRLTGVLPQSNAANLVKF